MGKKFSIALAVFFYISLLLASELSKNDLQNIKAYLKKEAELTSAKIKELRKIKNKTNEQKELLKKLVLKEEFEGVPFEFQKIKIGDIGAIKIFRELRYGRVFDPRTQSVSKGTIADARWCSDYIPETFNIIDNNNMILKIKKINSYYKKEEEGSFLVWVQNFATEGLVDNALFETNKVFKVIGTKQYKTTISEKNTILLLAPFDLSPFRNAAPTRSSAR